MRMKLFLTAILALTTWTSGANTAASVSGEVIVRFQKNVQPAQIRSLVSSADMEIVRNLVPTMNIYLVRMPSALTADSGLQMLQSSDLIHSAQRDHFVTLRAMPNDSLFKDQWGLHDNKSDVDVNAPEAWELGTGGKDAAGNDIVVAVVDGGVDYNHNDLKTNMWINKGEIAGNGVDDDNNGYKDDIYGWNAYSNNGNISADRHGTHVSGIVGASGNDGNQVTGVNWNVKIMGIAGASGRTSTVLAAYGYALKQKVMWIETKGQSGANVVSTNSSFGVDFADCTSKDYPMWNAIYDEMGKNGILSAAATANRGINIDQRGDVPTGCSSDYLITVTNTTKSGKKNSGAGYGKTTIDLGAPGTAILSTLPGNRTGSLTGTSMSTPHVAGAVALMHNHASKEFNAYYLDNPGKAALILKDIMLKTVTPQADLKGVTVSEGRLNLYGAGTEISTWKK